VLGLVLELCWTYLEPMLGLYRVYVGPILQHVALYWAFGRYFWLVLANFAVQNAPQQQLGVVEVVLGLVLESFWAYV
jgi:hypothetical protein